jgi:hypothetical protein
MSSARPLVFLDVDGVLNAFRAWRLVRPGRGLVPGNVAVPPGYRHAVADGFDLLLRPEHADWVADLERRAELVWATMWQDRAPAALAPVVGFGADWPYVDFHAAQGFRLGQRTGQGVGSYKFPGVVAWAGERPMVWVDDDLEPAIYDWAADRDASGYPTLLVQPSPAQGWTAAERDAVLAFVEAYGPDPALP